MMNDLFIFLGHENRQCLNEFAGILEDRCLSETYCPFIRGDTFLMSESEGDSEVYVERYSIIYDDLKLIYEINQK